MPTMPKHFRYEYRYITDTFFTKAKLILVEFKVVKETTYGYWIQEDNDFFNGYKKFVLKQSRKRFAYPTKEEALTSLRIRTQRRISYLNRDLVRSNAVLEQVNNLNKIPE